MMVCTASRSRIRVSQRALHCESGRTGDDENDGEDDGEKDEEDGNELL